jgi:predicted nucleic acid-binding protein
VIRAVADTNVLISALVFGGLPAAFLQRGLVGAFQLITSAVLLDELYRKLREKLEIGAKECSRSGTRLLLHPWWYLRKSVSLW